MKKPKRLKKPKLFKAVQRPIDKVGEMAEKRAKTSEEKLSDALNTVPRITNETVSEHREEVLSSARKFIYPLQHSKHNVVRISLSILALVLVSFFVLCGLNLYKFQSTSGFVYDVTRIVPFPVAKAGGEWVSYESYLFELRRNMHYYQTQQLADFSTKEGKDHLKRLKQQAMAQVVQDAYIKQLARQNGIKVTDKMVDKQLQLVRDQNRLGSNNRVFKDVLNEFWGWSEADFKRALRQQMLKQAVVAELDTTTNAKANAALAQLKGGADFAKLASEVSEDTSTKGNGGQYASAIRPGEKELPPIVTEELFKLKPGEISGIVNAGYTLEILKVLDGTPESIHAAHIQFILRDINEFVAPYQAKHTSRQYIKF